jgi:tRNA threonylcarbamoyladenosine biosynthesis protein TsaE
MPNSATIEIDSEVAMHAFGLRLAAAIEPRLVIGLVGDLGAGKTRLVKAAAEGLGAEHEDVNSPTFVLIQEYEGRLPVYHFDTYRLRDEDEFLELGADEYMSGDGVCFIEWANRMADVLPRDRLTIRIEITGLTSRLLHLKAGGTRSLRVLNTLAEHAG